MTRSRLKNVDAGGIRELVVFALCYVLLYVPVGALDAVLNAPLENANSPLPVAPGDA